jgi:hypothetical protein
MGQVTIYLEDEIEAKMEEAAKKAHLSKSKWISRLIDAEVSNKWPNSIKELAGSWDDFPSLDEIRKGLGQDIGREDL